MFENNITAEILNGHYTGATATGEILLIILVSFVLGWIARWFWDEFFVTKIWDEEIILEEKENSDKDSVEITEEKRDGEVAAKKEIKKVKNGDEEVIIVKDKVSPKRVFVSPTGIKNDDLKIVEGIGPKIEGLLKRAGIENWKDLSETSAEELRAILKSAGDRYSFHDPSTWPEQAMLAHENKWDELEEFQNFLSGGKKI